MRHTSAPILFDADDKAGYKAWVKSTKHDEPVHSCQSLLKDLATLSKKAGALSG